MKQILIRIVSIELVVVSCIISAVNTSFAASVTENQVRTAAENYVSLRFPATSGTTEIRTRTNVGTSHLRVSEITRLLNNDQTIGFVAHLHPSGYVLMRADDLCPPLKLYSQSSKFTDLPTDFIEILRWELAEELDILQTVQQRATVIKQNFTKDWFSFLNPELSSRGNKRFLPDTIARSSGPLLSTIWGQKSPYNYYAPRASGGSGGRAKTGCVAIAFAQILRYHKWPRAISGNYTYNDRSGDCTGNHSASKAGLDPYNWSNMPPSITSRTQDSQKKEVGKLIYHCGVTVNANFEAKSTSAKSKRVVEALRDKFSYKSSNLTSRLPSYTNSQWYKKIKTDIVNNRPVYYSFCRKKSQNKYACHAVVVDGMRNGNEIHINMGWGGSSNSWYDMSTVDTGTRQYKYKHKAIFNIRPSDGCISSIKLGQTVEETWSKDCKSTHRKGRYAKFYKFSVTSRSRVQIDLVSTTDTYLFLLRGSLMNGSVIAYDDDGGIDYNSKIIQSLHPGSYTIEATTYSKSMKGNFTLFIR